MSEDAQNPQPAPAPEPPPPAVQLRPANPDPEIWVSMENIRASQPPPEYTFRAEPQPEQRSED